MCAHADGDPLETVRKHFDELGEREWERLVQTPRARVSLELHRRLLHRFVRPGWRVLEVGAGPGRFTIELAAIGATIVTSDVSVVQLQLNARKVGEAGCEYAVEERRVLDVRDLSEIPDRSFDATIAFGGPISYAFEKADQALRECVRVTRVGGVVLASVMATIGTMRFFLPVVVEEMRQFGMDVTDRVIRTGDLRHTPADAHRCRMFRWREVARMLEFMPCRILAASASNATSLAAPEALAWLTSEPTRWQRYLDWEEELAQEPGAIDGGTHILFALEVAPHREREPASEERVAQYVEILARFTRWAQEQDDIRAVAVVGSWARRAACMDSDVDLVILTRHKERYAAREGWVPVALSEHVEFVRTQEWGPLTERRVRLSTGLEVEFGFADPSWAATEPVDAGTAGVVVGGCLALVDKDGLLGKLIDVVRERA